MPGLLQEMQATAPHGTVEEKDLAKIQILEKRWL